MPGPATPLTDKQRLVAEIDALRTRLVQQSHLLAEHARPASVIKRSLRTHSLWWTAGAVAAGFAALRFLLPNRPSKIRRDTEGKPAKKGKLLALLATPLLGMARKAVVSYATKQLQAYLHSPPNPQRRL